MRSSTLQALLGCLLSLLPLACVDPEDLVLRGTVDIIVVDGTVTNLAEPQVILLNYSRADRLTGRFGTLPITKARVEVVMDSLVVTPAHETTDGRYQLPADFKGQIGHAYQLRLTLSDGTHYESTQQVMPPAARIEKIHAQFSLKSLSPPVLGYYTSGHDVFIELQDPADQRNYYRWDWVDYEPQYWCRTCHQGFYSIFNPIEVSSDRYISGPEMYEECYFPTNIDPGARVYGVTWDYVCRTQCWEMLHSYSVALFDDQYTNGGLIPNFKVAAIPFYQHGPCLASVRQSSLTPDAYRYFKLFADQTQNTGGLADTPPTAPVGNVHNVANPKEVVVGYFTASGVFSKPIYIDRKDYQGVPLGYDPINGYPQGQGSELFYALNRRDPHPEPSPDPNPPPNSPLVVNFFIDNTPRPPTALCAPLDQRTPFKPEGWPN
ncbi:DUF4249 domain-containing protein [Spirosoma pollinicola]|uniref:DUF4249 domain-containing protein n=1 Tax=Spirosoma pollinicola TaxID=2057025 RepID=A0A2K8ZB42_9BACT|nr:DUF4249 domain-containing protein [Spirosoma pollinicola]AUD07050.1 DUF4249 domain-containing protein [Spirosoma pollinicola]